MSMYRLLYDEFVRLQLCEPFSVRRLREQAEQANEEFHHQQQKLNSSEQPLLDTPTSETSLLLRQIWNESDDSVFIYYGNGVAVHSPSGNRLLYHYWVESLHNLTEIGGHSDSTFNIGEMRHLYTGKIGPERPILIKGDVYELLRINPKYEAITSESVGSSDSLGVVDPGIAILYTGNPSRISSPALSVKRRFQAKTLMDYAGDDDVLYENMQTIVNSLNDDQRRTLARLSNQTLSLKDSVRLMVELWLGPKIIHPE